MSVYLSVCTPHMSSSHTVGNKIIQVKENLYDLNYIFFRLMYYFSLKVYTFIRLKVLLRRLREGDAPTIAFQQDLQFAIEVLENCYLDDMRWGIFYRCYSIFPPSKLTFKSLALTSWNP